MMPLQTPTAHGMAQIHNIILQIMNSDNSQEIFPVVDEDGRVTGRATRGECHGGSMLLHPVVHLHVFDREGRLYLQRRPLWKDIQPGKWDTAVGGHIDYGESVASALARETREELGIDIAAAGDEPVELTRYVFESDRERELVNAFSLVTDAVPHPTGELDGGRFWTRAEILEAMGREVFTPNFEREYMMLFGSAD